MQLNNGYQNLYLNGLDISVGGSLEGLKEQIRDILPNKVAIVSGVRVGDVEKLPIGVEVKKYITYTEEPEDWDEEEDGEFIPEEVFNLEIKNLYGYDLTIVDDVVSSAKTSVVSVADIEAGTIENAKPIYCHPIYISYQRNESQVVTITCLIFNNSGIAFTKETFFAWALALFAEHSDASIMASGYMASYPASRLRIHPDSPNTQIALETVAINGASNEYYSITTGTLAGATFVDGVNKIN